VLKLRHHSKNNGLILDCLPSNLLLELACFVWERNIHKQNAVCTTPVFEDPPVMINRGNLNGT